MTQYDFNNSLKIIYIYIEREREEREKGICD